MKESRTQLRVLGVFASLAALVGCADDTAGKAEAGSVQVVISGEDIATDGISFPTGSEVTVVDGWELSLSHVLVTISDVELSKNPDKSLADQSQRDSVVARAQGPWAVDLHAPGSVPGAGGGDRAVPLTLIANQNEAGGEPFASDERYAFGFAVSAATYDATIVNFEGDEQTEAAYAEMVEKGATVMYIGSAKFKGKDCSSSDGTYDFSQIPDEVPFRFAFRTPTQYVNCQNEQNQGDAFDGEEYQRGLAVPSNAAALAQITLHLEHLLFSSTQHDPSLYFSQMAAQLVGKPPDTVLTLEDFVGLDPSAFTDAAGNALPFRSCDGSNLPQGRQLRFDAGSVPLDSGARASEALRDYHDFLQYVQSAQAHLNGGEGLCFINRQYDSPP